jgi:hypothetical protein
LKQLPSFWKKFTFLNWWLSFTIGSNVCDE